MKPLGPSMCPGQRCLWINREDPYYLQEQRQEAHERERNLPEGSHPNFFRWPDEKCRLPLVVKDEHGSIVPGAFFEQLRKAVVDNAIDVVGIDPLVFFRAGINENDNSEAAAFMAMLSRSAKECNLAIVVCHHAHKYAEGGQGASRGASALIDASRCSYFFGRASNGDVLLTCTKASLGEAVMSSRWTMVPHYLTVPGQSAASHKCISTAPNIDTPEARARALELIGKGRKDGQP
ncbi:MAG: AAA family ATPase, partial [Thermomicrobiales bacterium]